MGGQTPETTRFTFHNVSINTTAFDTHDPALFCLFTFHNVSINTQSARPPSFFPYSFTFHNVSINTDYSERGRKRDSTLHSTMFLLIQDAKAEYFNEHYFFTFHNVSINTKLYELFKGTEYVFTFHNVSINTSLDVFTPADVIIALHSTMFLLIQRKKDMMIIQYLALHSTMFLLIRTDAKI